MEAYPNQIAPIIEALNHSLPSMVLDQLTFVILDRLASRQNIRQIVKVQPPALHQATSFQAGVQLPDCQGSALPLVSLDVFRPMFSRHLFSDWGSSARTSTRSSRCSPARH